MKKELKDRRMNELLWRARQRGSFEKDLASFKRRHKVPSSKMIANDSIAEWLVQKYSKAVGDFYSPRGSRYISDRIAFLKKYNLPTTTEGDLMDDILLGTAARFVAVEFDPPLVADTELYGRRLLKIRVYEGATRDDLLDFVKQKWKWLAAHLKSGGPADKRIRRRTKKEEDELVFKLWEQAAGTKGYREITVQGWLRERGIERSTDAIKGAVARLRKFRK